MYMDGIGMRPALLAMAERLAAAGYHVLLPDLFYRLGAYTPPDPAKLFADPSVRTEWFQRVSPHMNAAAAMRDTRAFLDHFAGEADVRQPKIGVTGYCMGGRMALTAAGTYPERIAAAAAYHPGGVASDAPDSPHLLAGHIRGRIYVGRASEDQNFTDEQLARLEKALTDAGVEHVIETYPARHGWVPSDTPVHDPAAAERHWTTVLDLLRRSL
jgi:carboxymethylenebutenolidase